MTALKDLIWGRGSARQIMKGARAAYRQAEDKPAARVALASTHYSLVKRYGTFWQRPLGIWHAWCAARHAGYALDMRFKEVFTADQIDVISRIFARVPPELGGDPNVAIALLRDTLFIAPREMKPHTRALMLVTLGGLEQRLGHEYEASNLYNEAYELEEAILREDSPDRYQQLVRVLSSVGIHFYLHVPSSRRWARGVIVDALEWAASVSMDQHRKILAECRQHGIEV